MKNIALILAIGVLLCGCAYARDEVGSSPRDIDSIPYLAISPKLPLPGIVVCPASSKIDWANVDDRAPYAQPYDLEGTAVQYLQEAIWRMTKKRINVQAKDDYSKGIVLLTFANAPDDLKRDPEVLRALRDTGDDAYNANEAFFVRSEAQRVVIIANTPDGLLDGVVELLESVNYEELGIGPNWTYVPNYTTRPLVFSINKSGLPGFYIRNLHGASGQITGIGTLYQRPLTDPMDETVDFSYMRWMTGTRMLTRSMPDFPGHALQAYDHDVVKAMWQNRSTDGFLTDKTTLGPDASRPAADPQNKGQLWINDDVVGDPAAGKVFWSNGTAWVPTNLNSLPVSLDLSVPMVRQIIFADMKRKAEASFTNAPNGIFVFATDPEDGSGYAEVGKQLKNPRWYPEYLAAQGIKFPAPYALNGFKGFNQPWEIWDPNSPADTVFGFNNWLLREFDNWIDSLPANQQVTTTGKSKKSLVRTSLYSYNYHDVPPNFNLDPRIRVMIADYPKHRGMGEWKNFATQADIASAFRLLTPREPSGIYLILSLANYSDNSTSVIFSSPAAADINSRVQKLYDSGFKALSAEMDFNFGRMGLAYYLYSKLLWNPQMNATEMNAFRDRWLQRAFGSGWHDMKSYYDFMSSGSSVVNAPNNWGKAIRFIEAADQKINPQQEPAAKLRLDDLKQFWYFYYLMDSGQTNPPTRAFREFVWKGQMSYMTAMHMVTNRFFHTTSAAEAAGPEFNTGAAHYSATETQAWWSKILDYWKVTPVSEFADATLANGVKGGAVDLNDLVSVEEFQTPDQNTLPFDSPFLYDTGKPISFLTHAAKIGEEIGFKLYWDLVPGDSNYRPRSVDYGISRWNTGIRQWDELVDQGTTRVQSVPLQRPDGRKFNVVEARYKVPSPGTYRVNVGAAAYISRLASLNYDIASGKYSAARGQTFTSTWSGMTQSGVYFYIPQGTKSLDMEVWGRNREIWLYSGMPATGLSRTRVVDVSKQGTHKIPLQPDESFVLLISDNFNFPYLYSIPLLWAKSPSALLVPRAIAEADGLTISR